MKTCEEIRRENLERLRDEYGGQIGLNKALDRLPKDQTISQIINKSPDSKSGTPRSLGHAQARFIETKLGLKHASLDQDKDSVPWPFKNVSFERFSKLSVTAQNAIEEVIINRCNEHLGDEKPPEAAKTAA